MTVCGIEQSVNDVGGAAADVVVVVVVVRVLVVYL